MRGLRPETPQPSPTSLIRATRTGFLDHHGLVAVVRRKNSHQTVVIKARQLPGAAPPAPVRCPADGVPLQSPWPYICGTPFVYGLCMARERTNIELEGDDVRAIMDRYGVHTKTEAVNLALRHLAGQPMSREEALGMRGAGAIGDLPEDSAPRGGR